MGTSGYIMQQVNTVRKVAVFVGFSAEEGLFFFLLRRHG